MTQSIPTGTFGVAKIVVSADPTQGTHTTIAAALTSASSGDTIWLRDGTYTENLTGKAGVFLVGESQNTNITGKLSMTVAGTMYLQNLRLTTNSDNILSVSGSNASAVNLVNCYLNCSNGTGIALNNSTAGSGIEVINCQYTTAANQLLFAVTTGTLLIQGLQADGAVALSTGSSTFAAGTLNINHSWMNSAITCSGGTANLRDSVFDAGAVNTTALTCSGATVNSNKCVYLSGTASAINVSSGTVNSFNDTVSSSNANAITGAGTYNYNLLSFSGSSSTINATTTTTAKQGAISFDGTNAINNYVYNGSWTPTFTGSSANPTSLTYTQQFGFYLRIGNLVFAQWLVTISAVTLGGAAGNLQVSGLPFTVKAQTGGSPAGTALLANTTWPAGITYVSASAGQNTTNVSFPGNATAAAQSNVLVTGLTNTSSSQGMVVFQV